MVHICEGEKDAIRLRGMGFLALSLADGALTESNLKALKGRHIVYHEDNNATGRKKSARIAEWLHPVAASIRVMRYTDLPEKGDVSDWFGNGGTPESLTTLIAALPDERQVEEVFEWPDLEPLDTPNGPEFDPALLPDDLHCNPTLRNRTNGWYCRVYGARRASTPPDGLAAR